MTRRLRLLAGLVVALLAAPAVASAQVIPPEPIPPWPCPDCRPPSPDVVIEEYRVAAIIDAQVATTTVTQVFANRGGRGFVRELDPPELLADPQGRGRQPRNKNSDHPVS